MDYKSRFSEFNRPSFFSRVDADHILDWHIGIDEKGRMSIEYRSNFTARRVQGTKYIEVNQYKNDKYCTIRFSLCDKELNDLCKNSRRKPVQAIKAALYKRATGYHYTETTTVNNDKGVQITTYNKYLPPDPASAMILLKHWDKETEWTQDPATLNLKKQELELKKEHMESEGW